MEISYEATESAYHECTSAEMQPAAAVGRCTLHEFASYKG